MLQTGFITSSIKGTFVNSVGPDQTLQNVASDQGPHCLYLSTGISLKDGNNKN